MIASAGSATAAAGTFRLALQDQTFDTNNSRHVTQTASGSGVVDLAHQSYDITTSNTEQDGGPPPGLPPSGGIVTTEQVVVGPDLWIKSPLSSRMGGAPNKPWLHVKRPAGHYAPSPTGVDPSTLLDSLKAHGTSRSVGSEPIRGIPTTHYMFVPATPPTTNEFYRQSSTHVWVDDHGLVRQLKFTVRLAASPDNQPPTPAQTLVQTMQFYDFGTRVSIQPPPADQVAEMAQSGNGSFPPGCVGESSCRVTATTAPSASMALPLPTIHGPSPAQFRPVLGIHQGACSIVTADPPADEITALLDTSDGQCDDLGAAALTITKAEVTATSDGGGVQLQLTLTPVDAAALDRFAGATYGKRVALVMFGSVIIAPTVNATQFNGVVSVAGPKGVDPQTASNIQAALSG